MNQRSRWAVCVTVLAAVLLLAGGSAAQEQQDEGEPGITRDNGIRMNFRDVPLETVLDHLSETLGLVVVKSVDIEGRVTVISRQPLEAEEAVMVLNSVLHEQGYAAVRAGRTLRIVERDEAQRANVPVRVGNDVDEIAETDELITQVIPIRHAEAGEIAEDLQSLVSDSADVTFNASSNTIIMTDTSINIRRFVEIIAALDTAISSVVSVEIFPLEYANANDAANLVNEIFRDGEQAGGDDPRQRFARMFGRGRGGRDDDDENGSRLDTQVSAAADERTNTVVVSGPEDTLSVVAEVINELDANPMASQGVFVYELKNGQAANLQAILQTLFDPDAENVSSGGTRNTGARRGESDQLTGRAGSASERENQQPQQQQQAQRQPQEQGDDGPGGFRERMLEQLEGDAEETTSDLLGQVDIVADEETNSLLVMTAPSNFDAVRDIIEQLDRPVPQVVIKALVAEVTHSDDLDLGAEFSVLNETSTSELFTDFGLDVATGGMTYRLLETDLQVTIRALQEVGKLEVLSRPYILASDNQEAVITVGSEVPFITSTSFTELGGSRSTVRYEDIGIILRVTPYINPEGRVTMDVFPEISAISGESIEVSPEVRAPVIAKRSAESRVAIDDGRTIVIGGLIEDQKNETVRKVPLLGDIPLLGHAFRRTETETSKTELLIFLTPHIASDAEVLDDISASERDTVEIIPDAVEEGAYDRHLESLEGWSPDRVDEFEADLDPAAPEAPEPPQPLNSEPTP